MKKLFTLLLCSFAAIASQGQTVTATVTTPPCNADGVVTTNFSGLTAPITVTYYLPTGAVIHSGITGSSDMLTGYPGSSFYISATGTGGTTAGTYLTGTPPFTYSVSTAAALCPALGTGTATVTGGTAPYTYVWTNSSTSATYTGNPASLPAGAYDIMITDAAGCTYGSIYGFDSIVVENIAPFTYSVTTTAANCTNGTASVGTISGGTAPYSYLWSTSSTASSIAGLSMGYYYVTVTDASGCSSNQYAYVSQAISISAPVTPTPATCTSSDGSVIAFGSGGMPPYTYLWSNGATTQSQSGLASGYYSVVVTDANGCLGDGGGYVSASTPITVTYTSSASSCTAPTGSATLTLAGGTSPYTVSWGTYPVQTGLTASALPAGTYGFNVTDAVGCVQSGAAVINPVDIINLYFGSTPATCALSNGSVHVSTSGGVAPLTYAWMAGGTTTTLTGVPGGYYGITVTDANGCSKTGFGHVPIYSPMGIGLSATEPSCLFTTDGSIAATPYGGTAPYSYHWSTGATSSSISSLGSGYYSIHVSDASGCTADRYTALHASLDDSSCYCTIKGVVYNDINGNCTQDPGENGIQGIQIHCSGMGYTYTDANGVYSFKVPTGSYTVSETVQTYYPLSACQLNDIPVSVVASAGCNTVVNFANGIATIHDIHVSTWDYNFPVPGNSYSQVTVVSNMGTVNEATIQAGYNTDGQVGAPSFVPAGVFGGSANWYSTTAFPTLAPGDGQQFLVNYSVPTDIPLGTNIITKDSAVYVAPMSGWVSDYTPWNNVNYFGSHVVGSYDPNFKEVSPAGVGAPGYITYADSVLEYMVHFQNTGTYYAENIVVIDTLDANLDWTTLRPQFASHNCVVTLDEHGVAKFTFNNIHLPYASSYPVTSNGMFTYTVKTRHGLAIGSQIKNKASIYFDYNAPIVTNRTLNTIYNGVGVSNVSNQQSSFSLYPNPADKTCYAVINSDIFGGADLYITDITGKTLVSTTVALTIGKQSVPVDVSSLAPGMYLVTLHSMDKTSTQKLVIMK